MHCFVSVCKNNKKFKPSQFFYSSKKYDFSGCIRCRCARSWKKVKVNKTGMNVRHSPVKVIMTLRGGEKDGQFLHGRLHTANELWMFPLSTHKTHEKQIVLDRIDARNKHTNFKLDRVSFKPGRVKSKDFRRNTARRFTLKRHLSSVTINFMSRPQKVTWHEIVKHNVGFHKV